MGWYDNDCYAMRVILDWLDRRGAFRLISLVTLHSGRSPADLGTVMFAFAVAGAPFVFGSRDPFMVIFWCVWLAIATLTLSPVGVRRAHIRVLFCIFGISTFYCLVIHDQSSDSPFLASKHPIWRDASEALGEVLVPSSSVARRSAFFNAGPAIVNVLSLLVGFFVGLVRHRAHFIITVVAWSGVCYAIYGIFSDLFTPNSILWREKEFYYGSLTGTFINKNTAATYFGSMSAIWLFRFTDVLFRRSGRTEIRSIYWSEILLKARSDVLIPFLAFFVCLSALFMTQSRAGVIISLSVMILGLWIFSYRKLGGYSKKISTLLISVGSSLVVLQFLAGAVSYRLETLGLSDNARLATYTGTLRMIVARPWFGTGGGTFLFGYPAFRGEEGSMYNIWDLAHSVPLQLTAEMGMPLASLIFTGWFAALVILFRGAFVRRRDNIIPLSALGVSIIALAHSTIDFSLQILGYSMVVFGILGVGLAQSFRSSLAPLRGVK